MSPARPATGVIEIALPSGTVVRGQHWPLGSDAALLLHEPGRDLDAWGDLPKLLHGDGLSVLAIDLPGHGLSDDPSGADELPVVIAALVHAVQRHGGGNTFIVAAGLTAAVALQAPAAVAIVGVVAFSPDDAGQNPSPRLSVPARPKLVFAGAGDQAAVVAARSIAKRAPGWHLISTFPTVHQSTALLDGPWGAQAREQTRGFLRECLHRRSRP